MKRIVAALLLFLGGSAGARAQGDIDARLALLKTTFLSTATAQAIMTVANHSAQAVRLEIGKTTFDAYAGGQWNTSPLCNRTCWRWFREIAPGSQAAVPIDLPACPAYSDPCSVTAVVHYTISQGSVSHDYTARLPTYQFVPDPTATFDVDGLSGNRPVFIVTGSATAKATPNLLVVWAMVSPFTSYPRTKCNPAMLDGLIANLQRAGISASEFECGGNSGSDVVGVVVSGAHGKEKALDAALQSELSTLRAVRAPADFAPSISKRIAIDLRPLDSLWSSVDGDAQQRAQRIATIVRAGEVAPSPAKVGTPTYGFSGRSYGMPGALHDTPFPFIESPQDNWSPIDVEMSAASLFVGNAKPPVDHDSALRGRAAEAGRWFGTQHLMPMQPLAIIAADRPELYVIGSASSTAALNRGLDPQFAAIEDARAKAASLAKLVGVELGPESLFRIFSSSTGAEQTAGVATAFSEGKPRNVPVRADGNVDVAHWNDLSHAGLPIGVPQPEKTIAEVSQATFAGTTNVARLQVHVLLTGGHTTDGPKIIAKKLLGRSRISGATAITQNASQVTFDLMLHDWNRTAVQAALGEIQHSYAADQPRITFHLTPAVADCAAMARRLQMAAIRQNRIAAQSDASSKRLRLRKLLLVSSSTVATDEAACGFPDPSDQPLSIDYPGEPWEMPAKLPLTVTVAMVYRTF